MEQFALSDGDLLVRKKRKAEAAAAAARADIKARSAVQAEAVRPTDAAGPPPFCLPPRPSLPASRPSAGPTGGPARTKCGPPSEQIAAAANSRHPAAQETANL